MQSGPLCPGRISRVPSREKESFSKWPQLSCQRFKAGVRPVQASGGVSTILPTLALERGVGAPKRTLEIHPAPHFTDVGNGGKALTCSGLHSAWW